MKEKNSADTAANVVVLLDLTAAAGSTIAIQDFTETTNSTATVIDSIVLKGAGNFNLNGDDDADINVTEIDASAATGNVTLDFDNAIDNAMTIILGASATDATNNVSTGDVNLIIAVVLFVFLSFCSN
jgi:hypothetical protein